MSRHNSNRVTSWSTFSSHLVGNVLSFFRRSLITFFASHVGMLVNKADTSYDIIVLVGGTSRSFTNSGKWCHMIQKDHVTPAATSYHPLMKAERFCRTFGNFFYLYFDSVYRMSYQKLCFQSPKTFTLKLLALKLKITSGLRIFKEIGPIGCCSNICSFKWMCPNLSFFSSACVYTAELLSWRRRRPSPVHP